MPPGGSWRHRLVPRLHKKKKKEKKNNAAALVLDEAAGLRPKSDRLSTLSAPRHTLFA